YNTPSLSQPHTLSLHAALPIYCRQSRYFWGKDDGLYHITLPLSTLLLLLASISFASEAKNTKPAAPIKSASPKSPFDPKVLLERSEEHTSELQSRENLVCRLLL